MFFKQLKLLLHAFLIFVVYSSGMAQRIFRDVLLENFRRAHESLEWALNDRDLPYWYRSQLESIQRALSASVSHIKSMKNEKGTLETPRAASRRLGMNENSVVQRARRSNIFPLCSQGKSGLFKPHALSKGNAGRKRR